MFQWCNFLLSLLFFTSELFFVRNNCPFSPFIYYLLVSTWTLECSGLWSKGIIIYIVAQTVLPLSILSACLLCPFDMSPSISEHCFTFWHHRISLPQFWNYLLLHRALVPLLEYLDHFLLKKWFIWLCSMLHILCLDDCAFCVIQPLSL